MKVRIFRFVREVLSILLIGILFVIGFNSFFYLLDLVSAIGIVPMILLGIVLFLFIYPAFYKFFSHLLFPPTISFGPPIPTLAKIEFPLRPFLYILGCILLIGATIVLLNKGSVGNFILNNHLLISYSLMVLAFQSTLRKSILKKQTWKKISTIWLKWTGVSSISIGGFGFIAINDTLKSELLKIITDSSFLNIRLMTTLYIITVALLLIAGISSLIGRASADSEDSNTPLLWFIPAFAFSWLAITSSCSLVFSSLILTSNAHLGTV